MKSKHPKAPRPTGKQVWCLHCVNKQPKGIMLKADYLIPARLTHYAMNDKGGIDKRVYGICESCLPGANKFQRDNLQVLEVNNPHIVNFIA